MPALACEVRDERRLAVGTRLRDDPRGRAYPRARAVGADDERGSDLAAVVERNRPAVARPRERRE